MTFQSNAISNQLIGEFSGVTFDAASNTYTITYIPSAGGPGATSDPLATRTLSFGPSNVTSTSGNFTTMQHADPSSASHTNALRVFKPGAANSEIALTYASFAILEIGNGTNFVQRDYIVFGSQRTSVLPTGTAKYAGIVHGTYNRSAAGQTYLITGTSTLTANFTAGTVASALNFTGANVIAAQPGLPAQAFSGNGVITATQPGSQFNGSMTGMGLPGTVGFIGNFYGPNAEEFGYAFMYAGATDQFNGVAVGKK